MNKPLVSDAEILSRNSFLRRVLAAAGTMAAGGEVLNTLLSPSVQGSRIPVVDAATGSGIITTIAGGGPIGNGGAATSASMSTPFSVSFDLANNLYIADNYFHRVYMVAAGTGVFSTVAGSGIPGYSGDGAAAVNASLNVPYGLVSDGTGNLYIADSGNACIRRVDKASGLIVTSAGTGVAGYNGDNIAANTAQLNSPRGVALDAAGNLYIADTMNARVRVVNMGTQPLVLYPQSPQPLVVQPGQIATAAGAGQPGMSGDNGPATAAKLNMPMALAFDSNGNLYIADYYNQRVRLVTAATGLISTVAGTGVPGRSGDGGPATSAKLCFPSGLAVDQRGNLYIGQQQSACVRMVNAQTQIISTVAGGTAFGFSGDGGAATQSRLNAPTGVAVDGQSNLYIADYNNARVRRVDAASKVITTAAGSAQVRDLYLATNAILNEPAGLSFDAKGRLYIADQGDHRIRFAAVGGRIATAIGAGISGFGGDGGVATRALLNLPVDVKVDAANNVYIADLGNQRIRRVDGATWTITTAVGTGSPGYSGDNGPASAAALNGPRAIAFDANGNLYIADINNQRVRFVNTRAQPVTLYAGSPNALTVQPGFIITVVGTGTAGSTGDGGPAISATVSQPRGVFVDGQGNLYVTEGGRDPQTVHFPPVPTDSRIRKVDGRTGIISTIAGTDTAGYNGDNIPAITAQLNGPRAVTVDAAGNVYIADSVNQRVRRVDAQTQIITTVVGTGTAGFSGDGGSAASAAICLPRYVALDAAGNLYITDLGNSRIRRVSLATAG